MLFEYQMVYEKKNRIIWFCDKVIILNVKYQFILKYNQVREYCEYYLNVCINIILCYILQYKSKMKFMNVFNKYL